MDDMLFGRARFPNLAAAEGAARAALVTRVPSILLWWRVLWVQLYEAVAAYRAGKLTEERLDEIQAAINAMVDFSETCCPEVDYLDGRTLCLRIPLGSYRLYVDFDVDLVVDEVIVEITGDQSEQTGRKTRIAAAYFAASIMQGEQAVQIV